MTTAVDSNVLLDLLSPDSQRSHEARQALDDWHDRGPMVVSEPVFGEVSVAFDSREALEGFLSDSGMRVIPSSVQALFEAGLAWKDHVDQRPRQLICPGCGSPNKVRCAECGREIRTRQHLIPDFLVGAHASVHADRLLTRDRGFYRRYFGSLSIVEY